MTQASFSRKFFAIKHSLLFATVFCMAVFQQLSVVQAMETVGGYGDFRLGMKTSEAKKVISQKCNFVDVWSSWVDGENCYLRDDYFGNQKVDISLMRGTAFWPSNRPITLVKIHADNVGGLYERLASKLRSRWRLSDNHKCINGGRECGMTFANNTIHLTKYQHSYLDKTWYKLYLEYHDTPMPLILF